MINKINNCILSAVAEDVDYFYFDKREGLVIKYNKPKDDMRIAYFIAGQNFLYNFIKNEFYNDFKSKNINKLLVDFTNNKITLTKQPLKPLNYELEKNSLTEQLYKIINNCQ